MKCWIDQLHFGKHSHTSMNHSIISPNFATLINRWWRSYNFIERKSKLQLLAAEWCKEETGGGQITCKELIKSKASRFRCEQQPGRYWQHLVKKKSKNGMSRSKQMKTPRSLMDMHQDEIEARVWHLPWIYINKPIPQLNELTTPLLLSSSTNISMDIWLMFIKISIVLKLLTFYKTI